MFKKKKQKTKKERQLIEGLEASESLTKPFFPSDLFSPAWVKEGNSSLPRAHIYLLLQHFTSALGSQTEISFLFSPFFLLSEN